MFDTSFLRHRGSCTGSLPVSACAPWPIWANSLIVMSNPRESKGIFCVPGAVADVTLLSTVRPQCQGPFQITKYNDQSRIRPLLYALSLQRGCKCKWRLCNRSQGNTACCWIPSTVWLLGRWLRALRRPVLSHSPVAPRALHLQMVFFSSTVAEVWAFMAWLNVFLMTFDASRPDDF